MNALVFSEFGSANVLQYTTVAEPLLKADEILVKLHYTGLNYADIYRRKGRFQPPGEPPYINGFEGAGVVVNANGHSGFQIGDRIGVADVPFCNAELVAVPVTKAIPLPQGISEELAASVLLQGLTADYLTSDSHDIKPGEWVVVYAAAGGVGQLLTQICKLKGAHVIGLTTSASKKEVILEAGADYAFALDEDWKTEVRKLTQDKGADVVYDSVGTTLDDSLSICRAKGHVVFYGISGGEPVSVHPLQLMKDSKTLTGGDLWSHLTSKEERIQRANKLFNWIETGKIKIKPPIVYKLQEGKQAHLHLESGKSAGKILLTTS